jgi:hypothetical protein
LPAKEPEVKALTGSPSWAEGLNLVRIPKPPAALATSVSTVEPIRLPSTVINTRVNTTRLYMMRMAPVRKRRATG